MRNAAGHFFSTHKPNCHIGRQCQLLSQPPPGTAPLVYQWTLNTTNISGATNATLVLTNVQLSQAGTYAVTVNNLLGSAISSNAVLTVKLGTCDPPPTGIISWWAGEANANDSIGANNGTLVGNLTFTNGEVGQAFSFDGSSAYVSIPNSTTFNVLTNSLTIEFWMKSAVTGNNADWTWLVSKGGNAWRVEGTAGGKSVTFSTTGPSQTDMSGTRNVNDGQWHHIAAVYDGTNKTLYVDGTVDVSAPLPPGLIGRGQ